MTKRELAKTDPRWKIFRHQRMSSLFRSFENLFEMKFGFSDNNFSEYSSFSYIYIFLKIIRFHTFNIEQNIKIKKKEDKI